MFPAIQENIDQAIPHLARCAQRSAMVAVREDAASAPELAIDGLRESDGEALDPASEGAGIVSLDQEMHVIRLNRVVRDAKPRPRCRREAVPHHREEPAAA